MLGAKGKAKERRNENIEKFAENVGLFVNAVAKHMKLLRTLYAGHEQLPSNSGCACTGLISLVSLLFDTLELGHNQLLSVVSSVHIARLAPSQLS